MFAILLRVEAQPGKYQELFDFLKWDGEHARDHEPGTLRFDFYRDPKDANAFYVYEAYRDRDAFEEHKKGEPFQRWSAGLRDALGTNFTVTMLGDAIWSPHG
jgi:autoinducer 2-degrading protein